MYSREEILAMPAGRELDELVATHVMGAPNETIFFTHWGKGPFHFDMDGNEILWKPSKDIAAAWEVVKHINKTSHRMFAIEIGGLDNPGFVWRCVIKDSCSVEAETAELAICKAALLSLLKED